MLFAAVIPFYNTQIKNFITHEYLQETKRR